MHVADHGEPGKDAQMDLQAVFQSQEMCVVLDVEGRMIDANQPFIVHTSIPLEQLRGEPFTSLIEESCQVRFNQVFAKALRTGHPSTGLVLQSSTDHRYEIDLIPDATQPVARMLVVMRGLQSRTLDLLAKNAILLERRASQLALLNHIGGVIASALDLDQVLHNTVNLLQKSFGYFFVALYLADESADSLKLTVQAGSYSGLFPDDHAYKVGQGIVGYAAAHRQTLLANNVVHDPRYVNSFPDRIPTRSELAVPILAGETLCGVIDLQSPLEAAFDENDERVIESVARQLALAMINARLYSEARQRLEEKERAESLMRLQRDLLAELTRAKDFKEVLQIVLGQLTSLQGLDCGSIFLVDLEGGLDMVAHIGLTPAFAAMVSYLPPQSNKAKFIRKGQSLYKRYSELAFDPRLSDEVRKQENILSLAELPVFHQSKVIANLTLGSHTLDEIPHAYKDVLEAIASQLGSTIARILVEKELASSEARNAALLEALPDLFFVCDSNGRFIQYKAAPDDHLYVDPEQFLGKKMGDIFAEDIAISALETIRKAIATHETQVMSYSLFSTSHQRQEYFEVRISAVDDNLVILLVRNVTEQTRMQTEIIHREHKYRALFEQNKDPVLLMTIEGTFIDANQAALDLTGYSRDELIGMSFRKLVHPTEMEQAESRFSDLQAGKLLPKYERSIVSKAGRKIRCEFNTARVDDVDGTPLHIQSILREMIS